jgi:hypothetical protein
MMDRPNELAARLMFGFKMSVRCVRPSAARGTPKTMGAASLSQACPNPSPYVGWHGSLRFVTCL